MTRSSSRLLKLIRHWSSIVLLLNHLLRLLHCAQLSSWNIRRTLFRLVLIGSTFLQPLSIHRTRTHIVIMIPRTYIIWVIIEWIVSRGVQVRFECFAIVWVITACSLQNRLVEIFDIWMVQVLTSTHGRLHWWFIGTCTWVLATAVYLSFITIKMWLTVLRSALSFPISRVWTIIKTSLCSVAHSAL